MHNKNKERAKKYAKKYRTENSYIISLKKKKYQEKNKNKISDYMKKYYLKNKESMLYIKREYYKRNSKKLRDKRIINQYGISQNEYDEMFIKQGGVCEICLKVETSKQGEVLKSLSIDHDHESGKVRGLLCGRCNAAIGLLKEDIELFEKAKKYLLKYDINQKFKTE